MRGLHQLPQALSHRGDPRARGRAHIIEQRCIDCGECIRQCQHHAKVPTTDPLAAINRFPYKIALPAPALYGSSRSCRTSRRWPGLRMMGFDEVYDVARGADIVSMAVQERLKQPDCPRPLISSSCPAVVRLIQIRFPELIDNIVDVRSPMEMAAVSARREFCEKHSVKPEEVGCFFISPCAAKMTAIRRPLGHQKSAVDGVISIVEVFGLLSTNIRKAPPAQDERDEAFRATGLGLGWARTGGEALAAGIENALAVDGIDQVAKVLEEIENNRLPELTFFEGLSCVGGCVGGPLTLENGFIARNRIRALVRRLPAKRPDENIAKAEFDSLKDQLRFDSAIEPVKAMQLDQDLQKALSMMDQIEEIRQAAGFGLRLLRLAHLPGAGRGHRRRLRPRDGLPVRPEGAGAGNGQADGVAVGKHALIARSKHPKILPVFLMRRKGPAHA